MTISEETWAAALRDLGDERQAQQERAERAETDRDAALDLLREAVGILHDARDEEDLYDDSGRIDAYLDHADAFLARVDSGTEPK